MKFFIRTFGCQMNELDSQLMQGILESRGYTLSTEEEADILIYNTCSVRDLAERKVMGKIGLLSRKKKSAIIGVTGCMAMSKKEALLKKFPQVDFVLGTNNISDLSKVLDEVILKKERVLKTDEDANFADYSIAQRPSKVKAFVSIMKGCNNFCSYCIVPYVRGREKSRELSSIIEECQKLADSGYKEITLLGQNVNSWGKEWNLKFSDLLYGLDKINALERIRFLTSHPKDISVDLMHAIKDLPSVCEFVHFPAQSGSSRILKLMNRRYDVEEYLQKVTQLKEIIPNVTIGTDIIVGFPSESEEDFKMTLDLFEKVRFSTAFIFAYSPRKNTPAFNLTDDVSEEIKNSRLQSLMSLYHAILDEENKKLLNTTQEVLVERFNKDNKFLKGKTRTFKKVIFAGSSDLIGTLQMVKLLENKHETFIGKLTSQSH
jgi:tRNA-2-methylthio-N6-dimethylallyladenosine synthase